MQRAGLHSCQVTVEAVSQWCKAWLRLHKRERLLVAYDCTQALVAGTLRCAAMMDAWAQASGRTCKAADNTPARVRGHLG